MPSATAQWSDKQSHHITQVLTGAEPTEKSTIRWINAITSCDIWSFSEASQSKDWPNLPWLSLWELMRPQHTVAWVWTLAASQKCLTLNMKKNKNQFWELTLNTFLFKTWLVMRNCITATKTLPAVILESIRDFIKSIWLFHIHKAPPTKKEKWKICRATGRCFMRSGINCVRSVHICTFIIYTHTSERKKL